MTGNNKYVLSIYSKWLLNRSLEESKLDLILMQCRDELTMQDIRQFSNIGIPVVSLNLKIKQGVLDYILHEVKEAIPVLQNRPLRKSQKAFDRLGKAITKQIGL